MRKDNTNSGVIQLQQNLRTTLIPFKTSEGTVGVPLALDSARPQSCALLRSGHDQPGDSRLAFESSLLLLECASAFCVLLASRLLACSGVEVFSTAACQLATGCESEPGDPG
jgi:hypothetical protein